MPRLVQSSILAGPGFDVWGVASGVLEVADAIVAADDVVVLSGERLLDVDEATLADEVGDAAEDEETDVGAPA